MGRILSMGYETNRVGAGEESDGTPGGGGVNSTIKRTGAYAGQHNPTAGIKFWEWYINDSDIDQAYFRFYLYIVTAPLADTAVFRLLNNAGTTQFDIRLTTTSTLQARGQGGTAIGSASSALSTLTWYRVEARVYNESAGGGTADIKLDGVSFATLSNTTPDIDGFRKMQIGIIDSTTAVIYTDDIAVNDTTGSFQNAFPGDGGLVLISLNAAGDNAAWTPSAGSNYQNVDETPDFNDVTDYNSSNTLDQIDDYNMTDSPAAIGSTDTINCIQVGVRFTGVGASANASFVLRIKASSGGTVEESANITPTGTTWTTNATDTTINYLLTVYDLPGASTTAYTKADIDTTQIGVRLSATSTNAVRVTKVWMYVDFTPAAGGATIYRRLALLGVGN